MPENISLNHIAEIWSTANAHSASLEFLFLTGKDPVFPSSFSIGVAAQTSLAVAALAAAVIRRMRGREMQRVSVDMQHAAVECATYFTLNGKVPRLWDKLSGLYRCGDGSWVRIDANFANHRDVILKVLELPIGPATDRVDIDSALTDWTAVQLEEAVEHLGGAASAVRTFDEWDSLEQARVVADLPLIKLTKIGDAEPRKLPQVSSSARPLSGVRVLELTRILAGQVAGRTLAAYGAEVLLINSPKLPNIEALPETSHGKLSALIDLESKEGNVLARNLLEKANVFVQGYRPGGMTSLGFGPEEVATLSPGCVYVSVNSYGSEGPWARRHGCDSLVQSAMGFNLAEAKAAGSAKPRAMPIQILDYASGYLMSFGAQMALMRQQLEGGTWHVEVSLARTGQWLRGLDRVQHGLSACKPEYTSYIESSISGFGQLESIRHAALFSDTPAIWTRPSVPPGTNWAMWPELSI